MKQILFSFPVKVLAAFVALVFVVFAQIVVFVTFDRGDLPFGMLAIVAAVVFFVGVQVFCWDGLSKEAGAVWDYGATLLGGVAALVLVLGGISAMGDAYRSQMDPHIENRIDDAINLYTSFLRDNCIVNDADAAPTPQAAVETPDPPDQPAVSEGADPVMVDMCSRATPLSEALAMLKRPVDGEEINQVYRTFIEPLPDHLRYSGDPTPSFERTPLSTFRTGASVIAMVDRLLARETRFAEGDKLLTALQSLTRGQLQLFWGLMLWNALSIKCGLILAKRKA